MIEANRHTFRTFLASTGLIATSMARPGTQEQPGPAGLIARLCSVYHNENVFTHGFIGINFKHCDT